MMKASALGRWAWVHKWSSLVCTVFMLLLCVTGLPLIFHHEIHDLTDTSVPASKPLSGAKAASLDAVVAASLARIPGHVVQFIFWDEDDPAVVIVSMGETPSSDPGNNRSLRVDAYTANVLDEPNFREGFMYVMLMLHVEMFAGLPGKLFLGVMGLLFIVAVVSGFVVYKPSMKKLSFGDIRWNRVRLVKWLDLHNLLGIVVVAWMLVVGFTGVINTWADLVIKYWQNDQLVEMIGQHKDRPTPKTLGSVQAALDIGLAATPGMKATFIGYPGTFISSASHYAVFFKGTTPLTSRMLKPVIVDAAEPTLTDTRDMPWYVTTLLLSQPLHFGDYGGMPLKVVWAILDIITIVVLGSGLYLWIARRGRRLEQDSLRDREDAQPLLTAAGE